MIKKLQIGIDLGTTHTLASRVCDDGSVELLDWGNGPLFPSIVGMTSAGNLVFGTEATKHKHYANFKREMGYHKKYLLGGTELTSCELSALLLQHLKPKIEDAWGPCDEVTLSVPSYFTEKARRSTIAAAKLADLNIVRLINEPTAAGIAFEFTHHSQPDHLLMIDLGGGTFDVSLLERYGNLLEVKATAGDCFLGGLDFTEILLEDLKSFSINPLTNSPLKSHFQIAENLKKKFLTSHTIPCGQELYTLDQHENSAKPLKEKFFHHINEVLRDSHLVAPQLSHVVLVGGATKLPYFKSWIEDYFPRARIHHQDPETLVAQGTALWGSANNSQNFLDNLIVSDINPHSIGVKVTRRLGYRLRDTYASIIHKGVSLPCTVSQTFTTISPQQTSISLEIFQGESRILKGNEFVGTLHISEIPPNKKTEEIQVEFTYNVYSILEITAHVVSTGQKVKARFDREDGLTDPLNLKASQTRLNNLASTL